MSVPVENEVLNALMGRFRAAATVTSLLASIPDPNPLKGPCIFFEQSASGGFGFPLIVIQNPSNNLRGTDVEGWLGGRDSLIVDIFGPGIDVLHQIAAAVDQEITIVQPVDTTNFVLTILRRTGPWRTLNWREHEMSRGNKLSQLTADWLLVSGRKQGI